MTKPVSHGMAVGAYAIDTLDPVRAGEICRTLLLQRPRRLAIAGKAGAGKTSVCEAISGGLIPIFNHADSMKEEVLELLALTSVNGLLTADGGGDQFAVFCEYIGIAERTVREDCWDLLERPWNDYVAMCSAAAAAGLEGELRFFHGLPAGEYLPEKIAYVDKHKRFLRPMLVAYGQVQKELSADSGYWVDRTIARSLAHPTCLNGDTRFAEAELEVLEYCGWNSIYLWIDPATQAERRPDMTPAQIADPTETSIDWSDCELVLDARRPLGAVLIALACWLRNPFSITSFDPSLEAAHA